MRRLWPQLPRRTPRASWRRGQCDPGQSRAHQREEAEASASRLQEWPRLRAHGEVPERVPCHPPSEEGQPPRGGRKGEGASGSQPRGGPCRGPGSGTFSRGSHPGVCTRPRASRGTELYEAAPWGPQLSRQRSDRNRAWLLRSVGVGAPQRRSAGWARGSPLLGGEAQGIQAFISQRSASDCPVSPRQTDVSTPGPEHPGGLQPSSSGGTKGGLPRSQAIQPGAACIRPSGPRRC